MGMTIDGLDELLSAVNAFPAKFDAAAQVVAEATGQRIQNRALSILRSKVRGNPVEITVKAEPANRQVVVEAAAASGQPTELHLWLEYGTAERQQKSGRRTGQIRPVRFMRDAVAEAQRGYEQGIEAAVAKTIDETFS